MSSPIIPEEWLSKPRIVCGIMTGTSLDGIDVAIAEFSSSNNSTHTFKLIAFNTYPFDKEIRTLIEKIISNYIHINDVCHLNTALSYQFADAITKLCKESNFDFDKIDAIGMHGQTVWHSPEGRNLNDKIIPSTLQLGSVSTLAQLAQKTIVGDFRSADIAQGGQGAPLVPVFDYEFLKDDNENRTVLNIGGIANITLLPKSCNKNEIIAFDTGPGNVLIDKFTQLFFQKNYDENGDIAGSGKVIDTLLNELKKIPYIIHTPPKSTGRELFNVEFIYELIKKIPFNLTTSNCGDEKAKNLIATLTYFSAWSIAENIKRFAIPDSRIIISGGGINNTCMINHLKKELPMAIISQSDEFGIPYDSKEAICFAYLAYRTLGNLPSNLPNVTGAAKDVVLGIVANP